MPEKATETVGILPDSEAHIARLEKKLIKLKKENTNKITGKDLLTSMSQFKEIFMQDFFQHQNLSLDDHCNESVDKSYLQRKLLPEQPINTEETLALVKNDWNDLKDEDIAIMPENQLAN